MKYFFNKRGRLAFCFYLFIFLLMFSHQAYPQATQPNLQIHAQSAVLMDAVSGQVLYEQNPRLKIGPASFTKILTLYLAFDRLRDGHLRMDDLIAVSQKAWKTGGSKMFIKVGEMVSVKDLLKGIAIVSGNDACVALAEHVAGSEGAFVAQMNEKAKLLGLKDSHFDNSHGMPAGDQYTTAWDMALLARSYIKEHPEALPFHSTTEFEYNGIRQHNRNPLLSRGMSVDGLMTGYIKRSGYHLVATAKQDAQRMIAVVMGCDRVSKRARAAQTLLKYGFKNFSTIEVVKRDTLFGPEKVIRGKLNQVHLIPAEEGWVTVAKGREDSIAVTPEVPKFITAPIQKGQMVGKVVIRSEGRVLREIALFSSSDVPEGANLFWPLIGGGILGAILVGLIAFLRTRRSPRKRF
jgi:D-alanyl-D-alanine carboxypeptidase (penicillin-binding protein 5/6)